MTESGGKTSAFGQNFGRDDRVRTCGIDVPNVARYQLRHISEERDIGKTDIPYYTLKMRVCQDFSG